MEGKPKSKQVLANLGIDVSSIEMNKESVHVIQVPEPDQSQPEVQP